METTCQRDIMEAVGENGNLNVGAQIDVFFRIFRYWAVEDIARQPAYVSCGNMGI